MARSEVAVGPNSLFKDYCDSEKCRCCSEQYSRELMQNQNVPQKTKCRDQTVQYECEDPRKVGVSTTPYTNIQYKCVDPGVCGPCTKNNKAVSKVIKTGVQYECVDPRSIRKSPNNNKDIGVCCKICKNNNGFSKESGTHHNKNIQYECVDRRTDNKISRNPAINSGHNKRRIRLDNTLSKSIGTSTTQRVNSNFEQSELDGTSYKDIPCLNCTGNAACASLEQNKGISKETELDYTSYKEIPGGSVADKNIKRATTEMGVGATIYKTSKKIGTYGESADSTYQTKIPKLTHEIIIKIVSEDANTKKNEQRHAKLQTKGETSKELGTSCSLCKCDIEPNKSRKEKLRTETSERCNICNCCVASYNSKSKETPSRKRKTCIVGCGTEDAEVIGKIKELIKDSSGGSSKNRKPQTPPCNCETVQSNYIHKKYENLLQHYIKYHQKSCDCLKKMC